MWIRKKINELLDLLILNQSKNLKDVTLLDGFESKLDLAERNLGVNEKYFKDSSQTLTFDHEPADRIKTICPTIHGTPPFVAVVRNVYLVGGHHPMAITSKFKIIYEPIDHEKLLYMGRVGSALKGLDFKNKLLFISRLFRFASLSKAKQVGQVVLLTNNWTHYGHWLLEHITKVRYVFEFQKKHGLNPIFILEKGAPEWQYDLLNILDIKKNQTIQWNSQPLHVDKLILPSYPEWNFDDYDWLRNQIFKKIHKKDAAVGPRIYLSRKNCDKRIVENEDDLIPVFERHDIQILYPENYSVLEQIEIFMGATLVVGPNGSAFANIIFSPNPIVIEFHGKEIRRTAYKLSKIMGFTYFPFYCDLDDEVSDPSNKVDKYLFVDPDKLEKLLAEALY